jgi:hypothetical protein
LDLGECESGFYDYFKFICIPSDSLTDILLHSVTNEGTKNLIETGLKLLLVITNSNTDKYIILNLKFLNYTVDQIKSLFISSTYSFKMIDFDISDFDIYIP